MTRRIRKPTPCPVSGVPIFGRSVAAPPTPALPLKGGGRFDRVFPPPLRGRVRVGGAAAIAICLATPASAYDIVDDAIPASLTGAPGDAARGRAVILGRDGNCLLCHQLPGSGERFEGDVAPTLAGVGERLTPGQIRLRLVDSTKVNPDAIMPPYFRVDSLTRVQSAYRGKPVLTAEQIEDLVAFLAELKP
jgi:sulfur-oxidizing protein SoxX